MVETTLRRNLKEIGGNRSGEEVNKLVESLDKHEEFILKGLGLRGGVTFREVVNWAADSLGVTEKEAKAKLQRLEEKELIKTDVTGSLFVVLTEDGRTAAKLLNLKGLREKNVEEKARKVTLEALITHSFKIEDGKRVWRGLTESALWYRTDEQIQGYLNMGKTSGTQTYEDTMHKAEEELERRNEPKMFSYMGPRVALVDLGSGAGEKSSQLAADAKEDQRYKARDGSSRHVVYVPVDENAESLAVAAHNGWRKGVVTREQNMDFYRDTHELFQKIDKIDPTLRKMIWVGPNVVNFVDSVNLGEPFLTKIRGEMKGDDFVWFSALRGDKNFERVKGAYDTEEMKAWCFLPLKNIGFERDDVSAEISWNKRIHAMEAVFEVKRVPESLKKTELEVGDKIVTLISWKPSLKEFREVAERYFKGEVLKHKNQMAFIGTLK